MLTLMLGAPLYMPATRADLLEAGNGTAVPEARTIIFCTEDAIQESDLPEALARLQETLPRLEKVSAISGERPIPFRCIRPRNPETLERLLELEGISSIHAFVLPKVSLETLDAWFSILEPHPEYRIMITLESKEVFEPESMRRLRDRLLTSPLHNRIICLRIGALDLLQLLGLRRSCRKTIYESPLGYTIRQLVTIFGSAGFSLSAPAFECLSAWDMLEEELEFDVLNGLFCKTAIHPKQLAIIHDAYRVDLEDVEMAQALLTPERPAIFAMHERMCEKATHSDWARRILLRAKIYGTKEDIAVTGC